MHTLLPHPNISFLRPGFCRRLFFSLLKKFIRLSRFHDMLPDPEQDHLFRIEIFDPLYMSVRKHLPEFSDTVYLCSHISLTVQEIGKKAIVPSVFLLPIETSPAPSFMLKLHYSPTSNVSPSSMTVPCGCVFAAAVSLTHIWNTWKTGVIVRTSIGNKTEIR